MTKTSTSKSTPLLNSIFKGKKDNDTKQTNNNVNESNESNKNSLSNLFNASSKFPDRPNRSISKTKTLNTPLETNTKDSKKKTVKGGKKRVRNAKEKTTTATETNNKEETNNNEETKSTKVKDVKEDNVDEETKTEDIKTKNDKNVDERTVFVGNLPLTISRKQLASIFKSCGQVDSTRLRSILPTGVKLPPEKKGQQNLMRKVCANTHQVDESVKKTAQGYVVFSSIESVSKALAMNNTMISLDSLSNPPNNENENIETTQNDKTKFRLSVDTSKPTIDSTRSVFVGNLPYGAEEDLLYGHFSNHNNEGNVENVRIIRDPNTHQCKGFGYVLLKNRECVIDALRLHDSEFMNRTIRVQVCGKRFKGKRGETEEKDENIRNGKKQKKHSFEGLRSTDAAAKRIFQKKSDSKTKVVKIHTHTKKRRTYSEKNATAHKHGRNKNVNGLSKRAAKEAKIGKRVKKLQKRAQKGMGKTKS